MQRSSPRTEARAGACAGACAVALVVLPQHCKNSFYPIATPQFPNNELLKDLPSTNIFLLLNGQQTSRVTYFRLGANNIPFRKTIRLDLLLDKHLQLFRPPGMTHDAVYLISPSSSLTNMWSARCSSFLVGLWVIAMYDCWRWQKRYHSNTKE